MEQYEKIGDENKGLKYKLQEFKELGIVCALMGLENMRMNLGMIGKKFQRISCSNICLYETSKLKVNIGREKEKIRQEQL